MHRAAIALIVAAMFLAGCNKSSSPAKSGDAVQQKLQELAGRGATDCGRIKSQDPNQMKSAADCAMQAAQKKKSFYVAYDLPGMTVAVAGNAEGKLFAVESQQPQNAPPGAAAALDSGPCPSELRVAQSGRITCTAPGSFGGGHGGMTMPSEGHGGMSMPPAGTPSPHGSQSGKPPGKKP